MSENQHYPGSEYQELFGFLQQEHGLIITVSQMVDLIEKVRELHPSQPPAVKGAEAVKVQLIALQNHLDSLSKMTEDDFEKNVIGHRIGDLYIALQVIDKYADFFETESPTAAGEIEELHQKAAELHSLKQTISESCLKEYFPAKDMSFHDKVVFAIDKATAAGDGKEAIGFADWIGVHGYNHLGNGVWAQEGVVNSLTTTAQLYDIFKQQNK